MTTKLLLITILALLMDNSMAIAAMLGYAPPALAVESAGDIAVGEVQVSRGNGLQVRFIPQTVLKGHMQPGSAYTVDYSNDRNRLNYSNVIPQIAADAEGKPAVLLLGRLQPDGRTLVPDSMEGAVWPRLHEKWPPHQTPDTLEECILFVKALLANPKLKLKRVNNRDFLPDGYILPANSADVAPPDEDMRALNYRAPATAVRGATDIAVGMLQVKKVDESDKGYRNNGLEIKFIPQTVLKGSMQPETAYKVDYPQSRLYYRDYLPRVVTAAEGRSKVILLGRLHSEGSTFEPEGLDSAVWPRTKK